MKALIGFAGFGGPEIALREADFETIIIKIDSTITVDNTGYGLMHFSPRETIPSSVKKLNLREGEE